MQVISYGKSFVLKFVHHGSESYTKIQCEDALTALNYFNFLFPHAVLIDIEESKAQILI